MTTEQQWRKRQEAYKAAEQHLSEVEGEIADHYSTSFRTCRSWLTRSERKRLDNIRARMDHISNQIIEFLYQYSPRHTGWGSGVPLYWICTELTFEDAMTAGALSVEPPLAYGATEATRREFCRALELAPNGWASVEA